MTNVQTAPPGFNNTDWQLHKGNKDHARFLDKCVEATWLIWEGQQLTGEAFFQQPWLAEQLGVTVRHAQNIIAELLSRNVIEVDRRDQNYYRVPEFFSRPLGEWTKVAAAKIKAAVAQFFRNTIRQTDSAQKQASNPKRERSFKAAKTQPTTPAPAPSQPSVEEQIAIEKQAREDWERIQAQQKAQEEAERAAITQELTEDVQQVAEQVAKENYKSPKPGPSQFSQWVSNKLREYAIEAPGWFVGQIALQVLERHRYKFR